MNFEIIDIISLLTVALLLMFSVFLAQHKKGNRTSHIILSLFLFVNAAYIALFVANRIGEYADINITWLARFSISFGLLFGPLLYFYTRSITRVHYKWGAFELLHTIPFWLSIALVMFYEGRLRYFLLATNFQIMIYLIFCLIEVARYQSRIKDYFSSIEKINLSWLYVIIIPFLMMWIIDIVHLLVYITVGMSGNTSRVFTVFSLLINLIFAVLLFFKSLQHPESLRFVPEDALHVKYEKSRLTDQQKNQIKSQLINLVEQEKPYLNPNLTLNDLADRMNIHYKTLSQVLNEVVGKNFFDFINGYRIEEAKNLLADSEEAGRTVLEILYQVGFNSKSVFNTAFKKHTGLTPTEFRMKKSA